jgi:hypothetical protein
MTKIGLIIICASNVTAAQSQQVTMEIAMVFDAPYVGPHQQRRKDHIWTKHKTLC